MEERLKKVAEGWYLTEPALFMAFCSHYLAENRTMKVAMRSGRQMIEYNPVMMQDWNDAMLAERLKLEVARILLGHPYQRLPYNADLSIAGLASDVTLDSLYRSHTVLPVPRNLDLPGNLCFEEYYILLRRYFSETAASGDDVSAGEYLEGHENALAGLHDREIGQGSDLAALWEEDQMMQETVREMVRNITGSNQWGSLPANFREQVIAANIVRIDYRAVLSMFRASVIGSRRQLTRMKPSRRYGFGQMGSKRDFSTRLLVALDVSGSVSSRCLSQALSVINRFFKYGVESLDVIQFDAGIKGGKMTMKKAMKRIEVCGRGGTSFQEPVDMFAEEKYDGLIMVTDGYAPEPVFPEGSKGRIMWMIYAPSRQYGKSELPSGLAWIGDYPRSGYILLPNV